MVAADVALLVVAVVLVVLAGGFVAAEAALSRVARVQVDEFVREARPGADTLEVVVADAPRYLNVLLLLRSACEIAASVLVTLVFLRVFASAWEAVPLAALAMVVLSYIGIGVSPRTLGRQHAAGLALRVAGPAYALTRVLGPIPQLLITIGNAVTPGRGFREGPFSTEAELRDLVDLAEERSLIEHGERQMIHGVFELGDTLVREVMVPRTDMVVVEHGRTLRAGLSLALRSGFSRIPVIGENLDDVTGVVYLKDLTRRAFEYHEGESTEKVDSVMRAPVFVPDSKPADEVLREMQRSRSHLAIVVDEYGGTAGMVTIEDILEEIVGEIADEYDVEVPPVQPLEDGALRVRARLPVEELAGLTDRDLEDDDVDTVGGLLAKHLGRVPIPGAKVVVAGLRLTAEGAAGRRNRIASVLVEPIDDSARRRPRLGDGPADRSPERTPDRPDDTESESVDA